MAQSLNTPDVLTQPIATNGTKNSIPNTNDQSLGLMSQSTGFPPICSERIADGGKAPRRADFNGAFNLISQRHYFEQNGGTETFRQDVSNAIGGYPLGARLWYTDGNGNSMILRSTKENNTDNFVSDPSYIGTSWVVEIPTLGGDNDWTGTNTFPTQAYSDNSQKPATTAFCRSLLSNIARGNYREKVQLISATVSSGTISLSQPYTDFDGLLVVSNSGGSQIDSCFISRGDLDERRSYNKTWALVGGVSERYWVCGADSTDSSFTASRQNCTIQMIYGINF